MSTDRETTQDCGCSCGGVQFRTSASPLMRVICHCTICQRFNKAPYADVVVYRAASVVRPPAETVRYETWRPPPNVKRGSCAACGQPAIELFEIPLFPRLIMVPAAAHRNVDALPKPRAHMFYDRRVADADDTLPKHAGYVRSQAGFFRYLMPSLLRR